MNTYRNRSTGELLDEEGVRRGFNGMLPAVLDADTCALLEVDPVLIAPAPALNPDEVAIRDGAVLDALGNWIYAWRIETKTTAEVEADQAASAAAARAEAKQQREEAVTRLRVTTAAGNTFDGDEVSQARMSRAIMVFESSPPMSVTPWVLADNSVIEATVCELNEALALAVRAQAELWIL